VEVGICKLCLEEKSLCDSHLVPSALYKLCRQQDAGLLRMNTSEVNISAEEVSFPLLCLECEERLNKEGENWLLPKIAQRDHSFPLYEILVTGKSDSVVDGAEAYACSRIDNFAFRKITNFAIGIFWKASVHSWKEGVREPRIRFGKYGEQFRLFLMNKGPFPQKAALTIGVAPPTEAIFGFNLPYLKSKRPYFSYFQHIPGMVFILTIGNQLSEEDKAACFYSSPLHPILVKNLAADVLAHVNHNTKNAVLSEEVKALYRKQGRLP
jgi:hypothetical protein